MDTNWDSLRTNTLSDANHPFISKTAYLYDKTIGKISWVFDLEKIILKEEIRDDELEYIPWFRHTYYDDDYWAEQPNCYWFLASNFRQLREPITPFDSEKFRFCGQSGIKKRLVSGHLRGGCFVCDFPELSASYKPSLVDLAEMHLKQFLMDLGGNKKFKEQNVQDALVYALLARGLWFAKEGVVDKEGGKKGRYDILFEKGDEYYAVEIKVADDPNAAKQLSEYINSIVNKSSIRHKDIQGVIVCGKASKETEEEARKRGYKVVEYTLSLDFPKLFE